MSRETQQEYLGIAPKKTKEQEALDALVYHQQNQMQNAAYQSQAMQAQNNMAGGGSGAALGAAHSSLGIGNTWGQTSYYSYNEKRNIEDNAMRRERQATIKLIEEMAEEVGAPNLLHAIVLAITSREYPTEE